VVAVEERVPAATLIPGLKFYLPFDALAGTAVPEVVSGKAVGKLTGGELVPGRRGKALRLNVKATSPNFALDLNDQAHVLAAPAEAPFALCMWLRLISAEGGLLPRVNVFQAETTRPGREELHLGIMLEHKLGRFFTMHARDGKPRLGGANTPFLTPAVGE
jgi:hypothetical protein